MPNAVVSATLLLLLLGGMAHVMCQDSPTDLVPDGDESFSTENASGVPTRSLTFRIPGGDARSLPFRVDQNGTEFPNVLITLSSLLPTSNLDIYCKAMTSLQLTANLYPNEEDYEWKSDHEHGLDFVFISKYHPSLKETATEREDGVNATTIACTVVNFGYSGAFGELEIQLDHFSKDLVEDEQDALQSIFEKCCEEDGQCQRWKDHIEQNNTAGTDFCHFEGNACNGRGNLLRLNLDAMNMSCPFPGAELEQLTLLNKLQLHGNRFEGRTTSVLRAILELHSIESITMSKASFTGPLAENISDANATVCKMARSHKLKHFECMACNITGSLPTCLFDEDARINKINLDMNKLSGKLPTASFNNSRLTVISLEGNQLSGGLPKAWTEFRFLRVLDLAFNFLNGSLPSGFGTMKTLKELAVSNNQFSGPLPLDILSGERMTFMHIANNQLSGNLTSTMRIGRRLSVLDLRNNSLSGELPESFVSARSLAFLYLAHNQFVGSIPEEFGLIRDLHELDLKNNQLSGPLPRDFSELFQLLHLDLSSNSFTGSIPEEWESLVSLSALRLSNNKLQGKIPLWIQGHSEAVQLALSVEIANNSISGFASAWYGKNETVGRLTFFNASHNDIGGEFPPVLAKLENLTQLDLSNNMMKGPLPAAAGSLVNVQYLNLSSNSFSGKIPETWGNITMFTATYPTILDLSNNELSGRIPPFFLRPRNSLVLRAFFLKGNNLTCPVSNSPSYIMDLDCGGDSSNGTRNRRSDSNVTTLSTLSERNVETNEEDASIETETDSSSSLLVPVLACVAAAAFVIALVAIIFAARSYKKRNENMEIPMTATRTGHGARAQSEVFDNAHMLQGIDSSNQV